MVALGRAIADAGLTHVPDFHDPIARFFLSEKGKRSLARTEQVMREGTHRVQLELARVRADLMALRTTAIDRALDEAIAGGATQVVTLGAGYDGRAWRLPELQGLRVFEVDHPATQRDKRARVTTLPTANANVTFVAMDFERDSLDAVLKRAGHDRSSPTCWIWEGVVMYLTGEAMRMTLAAIAGRSAPGSTLIVNYHAARPSFLKGLILRLIGEPQINASTPQEMAEELRSVGLVVKEDSGMQDWNQRFAQGRAKVDRAGYMRLAVSQFVGRR